MGVRVCTSADVSNEGWRPSEGWSEGSKGGGPLASRTCRFASRLFVRMSHSSLGIASAGPQGGQAARAAGCLAHRCAAKLLCQGELLLCMGSPALLGSSVQQVRHGVRKHAQPLAPLPVPSLRRTLQVACNAVDPVVAEVQALQPRQLGEAL